MKTTRSTKTLVVLSVILLAGVAVAFADWGGYGRHMRGYGGPMMGYGGGYGPGYGYHMRGYGAWGNLSEEDAAKLDSARQAFFEETRDLREQIEERYTALQNEMDKENPDATKVADLQKQVSELRAEFDQKAIAHRLEIRTLLPEDYQGRGFGPRGARGPGYCW